MTISQTNSNNLIVNFPSLNLAISRLIDKQEKDWGYFQVKKEDEFFSLYIPFLPCLRLHHNLVSNIYKAYWSNPKEPLPDLTNKTQTPKIFIKKKTKKVYAPQQPRLQKKQRTYEVVYEYDSRTEIHLISKAVANAIRNRIEENVSDFPEDEIMPLVIITEKI